MEGREQRRHLRVRGGRVEVLMATPAGGSVWYRQPVGGGPGESVELVSLFSSHECYMAISRRQARVSLALGCQSCGYTVLNYDEMSKGELPNLQFLVLSKDMSHNQPRVPSLEGGETVLPETSKMLKLAEQCLERAQSTATKLGGYSKKGALGTSFVGYSLAC